MNHERYLNDLKQYLEATHFSKRTVETYTAYAKRFFEFLGEHYPRVSTLERITKDIVLDFQNYLAEYQDEKGDHLSNGTQTIILRSVKKLFWFLMQRDLILKDPTTVITFPKHEQRLTRNVPTEDEVFRLLEKTKPRNPLGLRNRAILELLYSCGIRTSELCSLRVQDVDLKEQTVSIVKGKGGKSRIVPIGQYASYYIEEYLKRGRKYMLKGRRVDDGYLFLSQRGNPFDKSTINKTVMKTVMRGSGLKKPVSCYSFRHGIATHLLAHKVDITYISKLLGHESLNTTQKYLKVEIGDLKRMHSLYHPRESGNRTVPGEDAPQEDPE